MVALTLVGLELQRGGFDPSLGLDQHFLNRAPGGGQDACARSRRALEQIDFLESLSPQLQEGLVAATLDGAETELAQVQKIAAAWKSGDPAPIERLLLTDMKGVDAKVYDTLLVGAQSPLDAEARGVLRGEALLRGGGRRAPGRARRPRGDAARQGLYRHPAVTAPSFVGARHLHRAVVAVAAHAKLPRVAAHFAVLHQRAAHVGLQIDLHGLAAIRALDQKLRIHTGPLWCASVHAT